MNNTYKRLTASCLIIFTAILLTAAHSFAATKYIRAGANGSGNSWSDAYGSFSAAGLHNSTTTSVRGNTYYVADGNYGSVIFKNAASGSTKILIKKAIADDHGDSSGWQASYGDGSANFSKWEFDSGTVHYTIDGQVGKWATDLPDYEPYGFRIYAASTGRGQQIIETSSGSGNIFISHVEGFYTTKPFSGNWYEANHIVRGYGDSYTFDYCWFHDAGNGIYNGYINSVTFKHSVLERNGHCTAAGRSNEHSEIAAVKNGEGTFEGCYIRDWRSTGGLIAFDVNTPALDVHGCVFSQTGYWTVGSHANDSNGALNGLGGSNGISIRVYNNTFVDLEYGAAVATYGNYAHRSVRNNIFYSCKRHTGSGELVVGGSRSHNLYYNSGSFSESGIEYGSGNEFIDRANRDYRLAIPTTPGDSSIGSAYLEDPKGNTRGADGTWDRGAFEYTVTSGDASPTIRITTPTTSTAYSTEDTTINLSGTASDDVGISSVSWSCTECTPTSGSATGTTSWSLEGIGLSEGDNTILVVARDTSSQARTDMITINCGTDGGAGTANPPPPPAGGDDSASPVLSNLTPTGQIDSTSRISLSVRTDETATCKADLSKSYFEDMLIPLTSEGSYHHVYLMDLDSSTSHTYYVRCRDASGNTTSATAVNFETGSPSLLPAPRNLEVVATTTE